MVEGLDLKFPLAERDFLAEAAARGERDDFVGGKCPLGEDIEHFPPDIPGRADYCNLVTHRLLSTRNPPMAGVRRGRSA